MKYLMPCYGVIVIYGRSREGAWIEILGEQTVLNKEICRSREGAWIEIRDQWAYMQSNAQSLPRGSVD